tara:strand:- start:3138 stop:3542 length:405 start_codon:yes stop_codon:yes gene_type:complete
MSKRVWNIDFITDRDDIMEYVNKHYNKASESLREQSAGELECDTPVDITFDSDGDTTILSLNIIYNKKELPYYFLKTYIKYDGNKNRISMSYNRHKEKISIKSKKDFKKQFYKILLKESTGSMINHLLRLNNLM